MPSYAVNTFPTILPSAARTVSGTADFDFATYSEVYLALDVTAVTGTVPTLDIKVQISPDGVIWYDEGTSFTQVTAASRPPVKKITNFGKNVRIAYTIGGTTPSFTFSLVPVVKG